MRNALVFTGFQWGSLHLDQKSAYGQVASRSSLKTGFAVSCGDSSGIRQRYPFGIRELRTGCRGPLDQLLCRRQLCRRLLCRRQGDQRDTNHSDHAECREF
jgi:hypothetical protein